MIPNEDAFLAKCKGEGIIAFESDYVLSVERDIILSNDDIDEFFSFCKANSLSTIFYNYTYDSAEDYLIDAEKFKKYLLSQFENDWRISSNPHVEPSFFQSILPPLFQELDQKAVTQNELAKAIDAGIPTLFEACVPFSGSKIGIMLLADSDDENTPLVEQRQFLKLFENKLSALLTLKQNEARRLEAEAVRQREADYKNALQEMEAFLSADEKLIAMSKKGVRQEYADSLRIRWSEKIGQNITQKDVRSIVERIYLHRTED